MRSLPIETSRLVLRTHRPDDIDALLGYQRREDVARHLLHEPWTREFAEEQMTKRLRSTRLGGPDDVLALVIERDGVVIGDLAAWPTDSTASLGEIGWTLHPDHSGQGLATEAVAALLDLMFDVGMHRVAAQMDPRNTSSARLAHRVGMTLEATHRQHWFSKGEWTDTWVFAVLADDWRARRDDPRRTPSLGRRRANPGDQAPDREAMEGWLELYRDTVLVKVAGLSADQMCARPLGPSTLSLAGLVRHFRFVEQYWFAKIATGLPEPLHYTEKSFNGDLDDPSPATLWDDYDGYVAEVERSRGLAAAITDLDAPLPGLRHGKAVNLRWVLLHMIEEYARHLGHMDLIRERLDGATGY